MVDANFVSIEEFDNTIHAEIARQSLEAEGIPVYLHNQFVVETNWLYSNAVGNIRLQVPLEMVDRAREILAAVKPIADADEAGISDSDELRCLNCGSPMSEDDDACRQCNWSYTQPADD